MSTRAPGSPELLAAVGDLWPGAEVTWARFPGQHGTSAERRRHGIRLTVVPTAGGVGSALPSHPWAAARAVRRHSAAASRSAVAGRLALAAVLWTGAGRWWPHAIQVHGGAHDAFVDLMEGVFGEPVTVAVAIGTARVNRKRVVEVFDRRGRTLGFAKIGGSRVSDRDVRAESAALAALAQHGVPGALVVPRRVWAGTWRDAEVLVSTAVPHGLARRADRLAPPLREMRAFVETFAQPAAPLVGSSWWQRTGSAWSESAWARPGASDVAPDDAVRRSRAQACWGVLGERAGALVPRSAWHGDWTVWNMARHRAGLSLWDWERFDRDVPAGLDMVHHQLNTRPLTDAGQALGFLGAAAQQWHRASGADLRIAPDLLVALYLAQIVARYLPLIPVEGGLALRTRTDLLLQAWERQLEGLR